jgi:hypothetical protein
VNSKHAKTLRLIFADSVSAGVVWADVEALLVAVGCEVVEGSGSRVRFTAKGTVATFHRPHPQKEAKRYQVRDARAFLILLGVQP